MAEESAAAAATAGEIKGPARAQHRLAALGLGTKRLQKLEQVHATLELDQAVLISDEVQQP